MRKVMKILFVDQSEELQQKWVEPLRNKGWGVVRGRSAEDATRMLTLHGEALEALVVGERFVDWAEKQEYPFIVLTTNWNQSAILKHQNSKKSALGYLSYDAGTGELCSILESKPESEEALDASADELELEEYDSILARPVPTRTSASLFLDAPTVILGGEVRQKRMPEVEEISVHEGKDAGDFNATKGGEDTLIIGGPLEDLALSEYGDEFSESQVSQASHAHSPSPSMSQFTIDPSPAFAIGDLETLRSYLALREQDVAVLSGQLRSSQERVHQLEMLSKTEKARSAELTQMLSRLEQQIKNFNQDKQSEHEFLVGQIEDLNLQVRDRADKSKLIETKLRQTLEEVEKIKERVRVDIRRIRVREKELEGQLEVSKKDSSALLQARDEKILELKRKVDLLEFNMELMQEQFSKEKQTSDELKNKLKDAAQAMKRAGGLLEQ